MPSQLPKQTQPIAEETRQVTRPWYLWFAGLQSYAGPAIPFRSLPANPQIGQLAVVSDSTTATWGATIASTSPAPGATVLSWYNGTNWTVVGA